MSDSPVSKNPGPRDLPRAELERALAAAQAATHGYGKLAEDYESLEAEVKRFRDLAAWLTDELEAHHNAMWCDENGEVSRPCSAVVGARAALGEGR